MSPLKHLLFSLNNLVHPICPAASGFLDFVFSLLSKHVTSLEIRNLTQEKVLQPGSTAVLREGIASHVSWVIGLFECCNSVTTFITAGCHR